MRNAFAAEITKLGAEDKRVVLLSGDIGNRLFDKFKDGQAERFFNCGVAEQNMIGVAAGMGLSGLKPVVYTINSFLLNRCYEQIRLDVAYHKLPIVLVGVGGGLGYASLGPTHHSCEDVAIMRALPNMTVLCPADPVEVKFTLRAALKHDGPVFIRIGKKGEEVVHKKEPAFKIGQGLVMREGKDICILSTGVVLPLALQAAEAVAKDGHEAKVISMPTIKPLNTALLGEIFSAYRLVATVEEHNRIGGFGSAVAEWLADNPQKGRLVRFGTNDAFLHEASTLEYAREKLGLSLGIMTKEIKETWRKVN